MQAVDPRNRIDCQRMAGKFRTGGPVSNLRSGVVMNTARFENVMNRFRMCLVGVFAACCVAGALVPVAAIEARAASGSDLQPELRDLLSNALKFSPSELTDLEQGKVVAHRLNATAEGEAGAAGATRINGRKEAFVDMYRDIVRFKRGQGILAIGLFGDPPSVGDLATLPLDTQDVNLRNCRVGHCDIRLPASAINRFQNEIDWTASDADAHAATLFKHILADNVRAYVSGGAGRITEYDDEKHPVRPVDDFSALLTGAPYVDELVPGLAAHLDGFSTNPLPGSEDLVYWSKEKWGDLDSFVTVTHVAIPQPVRVGRVIASRDVYSSRFLDASLSVTIVSDAVSTPNAFYLVYVNRSRADALKGKAADLRRSVVERRSKSGLEENLKLTKLKLEGLVGK